MENTNEKPKLDLKYLLENNILKKGKAFGNKYRDTVETDNLPNLQNLNDIYYLIIEKIEFSIGTYLGGSINGINLFYKNIFSNEVLSCQNQIGHHHLSTKKHVFELDFNDYITSFIVVYGKDDVMRNVKIRTKRGKFLTVPFERKKENTYHQISEEEIIAEKDSVLVTLFYGVGGHVHNIGCHYLEEKFYRKIHTIYKLMNFHYFKKLYKGKTLQDILELIGKSIEGKSENEKVAFDDRKFNFSFFVFHIYIKFLFNKQLKKIFF